MYTCRDCLSAGTRKPTVEPGPLSEGEIAYCAGMLDGEGSIMLLSQRWLQVRIFSTYRPMLEWLQQRLGGVVCIGHRPQKANHKQGYFWVVSMKPAAPVLRLLLPWLQIKRRHAEVALEFVARLAEVKAEQRDDGTRRQAVADLRLSQLAETLTALNRKGPPVA
mgnify:CR=1 FL=1